MLLTIFDTLLLLLQVVVDMVKNRLAQPDAVEHGWLLDGYPRSAEQAEAIEQASIRPDLFLLINVRSRCHKGAFWTEQHHSQPHTPATLGGPAMPAACRQSAQLMCQHTRRKCCRSPTSCWWSGSWGGAAIPRPARSTTSPSGRRLRTSCTALCSAAMTQRRWCAAARARPRSSLRVR